MRGAMRGQGRRRPSGASREEEDDLFFELDAMDGGSVANEIHNSPMAVEVAPSREVPPAKSDNTTPQLKSYKAGFLAVAAAVLTWVSMGELIQDLTKPHTYPKFFFVVWTLHTGYTLWLATALPAYYFRQASRGLPAPTFSVPVFLKAAILNLILFTSDYLWYLSLSRTTVAANNAIFQSLSAFVYILSVVVLKEEVTRQKTGALGLCLFGIFLVAVTSHPGDGQRSEFGGYFIEVLSVASFALYEVLFKKLQGEGENVPTTLIFTGYMGLANVVFVTPLLWWMDLLGAESYTSPPSSSITLQIVLNAFFGALFTGSVLVGVALTSPIFMSMGMILVVPLGFVLDGLLHHTPVTAGQVFGCLFIIAGFFLVSIKVPFTLPSFLKRDPRPPGQADDLSQVGTEPAEVSLGDMDPAPVDSDSHYYPPPPTPPPGDPPQPSPIEDLDDDHLEKV